MTISIPLPPNVVNNLERVRQNCLQKEGDGKEYGVDFWVEIVNPAKTRLTLRQYTLFINNMPFQ